MQPRRGSTPRDASWWAASRRRAVRSKGRGCDGGPATRGGVRSHVGAGRRGGAVQRSPVAFVRAFEARLGGRSVPRDGRPARPCPIARRWVRAWTECSVSERRPGRRTRSPTRSRLSSRARLERSASPRPPPTLVEGPKRPGTGQAHPAPPPRPRSRRPSEREHRLNRPHQLAWAQMGARQSENRAARRARVRPADQTSPEEAARPVRRVPEPRLDRCRTRPFRLPSADQFVYVLTVRYSTSK